MRLSKHVIKQTNHKHSYSPVVDPTPSHSGHAICLCLWTTSYGRISSKSGLNFAKSLAPATVSRGK